MICKQCHADGKKSTVNESKFSGIRTLLYCSPYYDEERSLKNHVRNVGVDGRRNDYL